MTATSSTVSHSCDVTPYQTIFFTRTSNFSSSLTQQHCLLLLLLMELTEQNILYSAAAFHCTDSVQWRVQWTLCGVGAAGGMVAVYNSVIHWVVCG
jgi:hypothetical protein